MINISLLSLLNFAFPVNYAKLRLIDVEFDVAGIIGV